MYNFDEIIPISAIKDININDLLKTIKKYLPEGEKVYPEDEYTDKRKTALFNPLLNNYINNLNRVPVYGVRKLKRKGDISRDLVHSTIAYAHMAHKNRQLREVVGALEVLKD